MTLPLRTVLIGFGSMGATEAKNEKKAAFYRYASHVQVLATHPGLELVGVVDSDPAARESALREWGVPMAAASAEELDCLQPDLAVLAIPPSSRLEVLRSLPSLRAVLVEKPLALEVTERRAFVDYCRNRGLTVQVNYFRRADTTCRALAAGGLKERIGAVQAALGLYGRGLFNIGTHFIDLARMLLGEVAWVRALDSESQGETADPDDPNILFALRFAAGATGAFLTLDYARYREGGLDLWGSDGRLSLLMEGLVGVAYRARPHRAMDGRREIASDRPEALPCTLGQAYYGMYENLLAALEGREKRFCTLEEALRTEAVADAVLASARTGGSLVKPE